MCHHHWLIERRPDDHDHHGWSELDTVAMSNDRTVSAEQIAAGRDRALRLAALHAAADPDQAREIVICRYDCCGPHETERPFPHDAPAPSARELARALVAARAALQFYADRSHWRAKPTRTDTGWAIDSDALADAGQQARRALRSFGDA